MKKILSFALCMLIIFNVLPLKTFAEEEQSLEEIIRPQVEAFAKSIDQKDANGAAQDALITHGMFGNGKKLSVGKSHALTATLVNSELMKACLIDICIGLLMTTEEYEINEAYSRGECGWRLNKKNSYQSRFYTYNFYAYHYDEEKFEKTDYVYKIQSENSENFPTSFNLYDDSLEFLTGWINTDIDLKTIEISSNKKVYEISVILWDKFDFSTENGNALEDLLGWIGLLLFEPFEWESKFSFQIEVPIEKPEENVLFGDSDGNGSVDVADAYFVRLVAAKLVEPTKEQLAICDVDGDGKITAIDANIIRKFAAGIIKKLPVQ